MYKFTIPGTEAQCGCTVATSDIPGKVVYTRYQKIARTCACCIPISAAQNFDFGFINIGDMTEDSFALCGKKIQVKQHCRYLTVSQDVLLSYICSVVIYLVSGNHAMFGKVDTNVLKRGTRSCQDAGMGENGQKEIILIDISV